VPAIAAAWVRRLFANRLTNGNRRFPQQWEITSQIADWLAGAPGFEPGNGGIKIPPHGHKRSLEGGRVFSVTQGADGL
jgi:hypothetical protein